MEQYKTRRSLPWKEIVIGAIVLTIVGVFGFDYISNARRQAGNVLARVNGEPITEADVNRGFPGDLLDAAAGSMKQSKLERLIAQAAVRQFLEKNGVEVDEDLVDKEVAKLRANPPSQGCPCCTYPSLENYLATIGYTMDNLREEIRNGIGLSEYARESWKKTHPDKARALKAISAQRDYISKHYVVAWQIFFNTSQQQGFDTNPGPIRKAAWDKAQQAWKRLQGGESFEAVAKSVSEDMTSKNKGGALGAVDRSSYGREFEEAVTMLKPGEISKPFESSWGVHIVKKGTMREADVLKVCEKYLEQNEYNSLYDRIVKETKVERVQTGETGG